MLDDIKKKTEFIRFQVVADDKKIIYDQAEREGITVSALIRKALKQYLEGQENE